MSEDTEQANSTAQLESPQEIAADESNVVIDEPSNDGSTNMSLSELTTQLLAKDEEQGDSGESEVEKTAEEETIPVNENLEAEQSSEVKGSEEIDADKKLLLDKYGINLDELGEDDAMSLGRALRTESLKRFGRLTAQKREAEAQIKELENNAQTASDNPAGLPDESPEDSMSDVWTVETLGKKETDLQAIEDWAEDALQHDAQYDDDGEEYLVEADSNKYTKQQLLRIRSNARKMLRKGGALDKRRGFLEQRQQQDANALQWFPWMSDENSSEFAEYQELVSHEKYRKLLDSIPEANLFAGMVVEGNLRVRERIASTQNGSTQKEKPATPALAASAAPKRAPAGDASRLQKSFNNAKKSFEQTGSIQSLARLREVEAQMS